MVAHGDVGDFFNAADYFIDRNIREGRGDKVAVYTEVRNYTYNDLEKMINKTSNALKDLGVRVDDRVMLIMNDVPQFYAIFYGAIKMGAVPVPVNTMMTPEDYEYYLNDSRARALFISDTLLPVVSQIRGDLHYLRDIIILNEKDGAYMPFKQKYRQAASIVKVERTTRDDVGFWLYSSGSTGSPKGAIHSQFDPVIASKSYGQDILGLTENDILFSAARLFFAYGLGNSGYFPFSVGGSVVLNPDPPKPESIFAYMQKYKPTVFFGIPTLYGQLLEYKEKQDKAKGITNPDPNAPHEFSSARICTSAGEALPPDIYHRWKARFGIDILDGIGSTEMLHIFISNKKGSVRPGSTGVPVEGYNIKLIDEDGQEVPKGKIGTLLVSGHSAAQQYWRKREKSRSTMQGAWVNTGDKYYVDDDGYYWCAGRGDDMLKVGGIWVSPVEVENCLTEHVAVRECAVVGKLDEKGLTKPKAFVVLANGFEGTPELAKQLQEHVLNKMAKYKYPRWIEFVTELPKSATGKIQRYKLR
jgi:4-hydroxybenzoate-CoA ligase